MSVIKLVPPTWIKSEQAHRIIRALGELGITHPSFADANYHYQVKRTQSTESEFIPQFEETVRLLLKDYVEKNKQSFMHIEMSLEELQVTRSQYLNPKIMAAISDLRLRLARAGLGDWKAWLPVNSFQQDLDAIINSMNIPKEMQTTTTIYEDIQAMVRSNPEWKELSKFIPGCTPFPPVYEKETIQNLLTSFLVWQLGKFKLITGFYTNKAVVKAYETETATWPSELRQLADVYKEGTVLSIMDFFRNNNLSHSMMEIEKRVNAYVVKEENKSANAVKTRKAELKRALHIVNNEISILNRKYLERISKYHLGGSASFVQIDINPFYTELLVRKQSIEKTIAEIGVETQGNVDAAIKETPAPTPPTAQDLESLNHPIKLLKGETFLGKNVQWCRVPEEYRELVKKTISLIEFKAGFLPENHQALSEQVRGIRHKLHNPDTVETVEEIFKEVLELAGWDIEKSFPDQPVEDIPETLKYVTEYKPGRHFNEPISITEFLKRLIQGKHKLT